MIRDEEPDGNAMLKEIANIRSKLRIYVASEYFQMIRERAKQFGLINEATGENAVLTKDIKTALSTLQNTPENQRLVYDIFFDFHRDRSWISNTIDKWMVSRKMKLKPPENIGKKIYRDNRGGFTAVARHAKSNMIALFKENLYKAQKWCIASSLPSTKAMKNTPKKYTKVTIMDPIKLDRSPPKIYYVVTPNDDNDTTKLSSKIKANIDELLDVDYDAIARSLHATTSAVRRFQPKPSSRQPSLYPGD